MRARSTGADVRTAAPRPYHRRITDPTPDPLPVEPDPAAATAVLVRDRQGDGVDVEDPRRGVGLRRRGGLQQTERLLQHLALLGHVPRLAAGCAEREVDEQQARHGRGFDDVAGRGDHHGGNSVGFEVPGYQTHGLMADGSNWDQQGDIDRHGTALA